MTMDGVEDSPVPDSDWQQQKQPPRLQEPEAAVSSDLKHHRLDVKRSTSGFTRLLQFTAHQFRHQVTSDGNYLLLVVSTEHDHSPFNSSIPSASLPRPSRSFNSTNSTASEALDTLPLSQLQQLSLQYQPQIFSQPPSPDIDNIINMFSTMQTTGMKRSREADDDEAQQLHSHSIERRIARMRDNSTNATLAASNISENSISSSTLFLPSHERSSPPRARSNALSISHTDTTMTPCPSDTEDLNLIKHGFDKVPNLSLRSRKAPTIALSTAQSPAESFDSCSQYENEDLQETSMITEDSQHNSLMDMEMDDAPAFSPEASFSFKPPTSFSANPLLGPGASISHATNLLQTSGRLPSPADSDNGHDQALISELENSSMGMQLQGAHQDGQGKWRVPSGSRNMGHVADGMHFGKGGAKPRVSMGFRADCEKCIQRVPGHYMHIL